MKSTNKTFLLKDILNNTRLSPDQLDLIIKKLNIKFLSENKTDNLLNEIDNLTYTKILYYKDLRTNEEESLKYLFARTIKDNKYEKLSLENKLKINYLNLVKDIYKISKLHKKYKNMFDIIKEESAIHASYLIFGKIINYLNIVNFNIKEKYSNVLPYFRLINEGILLSDYFNITKNTEKGKRSLTKWYREDTTPSPKDLRIAINEYSVNHLPLELHSIFAEGLFDMHHYQSKIIHNSFNHVRSNIACTKLNPFDLEIEYNQTDNYRELLNLQKYLNQNLLTLINGFILCYCVLEKIFIPEDVIYVNSFQKKLLEDIRPS